MPCGGCGGRSLRKQQVQRPGKSEKQKIIHQRVLRSDDTATIISQSGPKERSVSLKRQSLVRDDRCTKCGYPIMLVNIAGRERKQCTSCKLIQK